MNLAAKLRRNMRKHRGTRDDTCEQIQDTLLRPILQHIAGTDDPQEALSTLFMTDWVTVEKMIVAREFEMPGDLLLTPYRRVPGLRGIMVSPGATAWVRVDRWRKMVDLEVAIGRPKQDLWISMPLEAYDEMARKGRLVPWRNDTLLKVRRLNRKERRRAKMRRAWLQAPPEHPCT